MKIHHRRQAIGAQVLAIAQQVDRDSRLMAVSDGGDDILGPERRVAAEENFRMSRLKCRLVDDRHFPFVELDADVTLDPRKRILLPDSDQHIVSGIENVGLAGRHERTLAVLVIDRLDLFEQSCP